MNVRGGNAYGGGFGTDGRVHPGATVNVVVAAEYTLTRHWVLAFDVGYFHVGATRFSGTTGVDATGAQAVTGKGAGDLLSLAPAVEYNFTEQLGVIVGPWFSVAARHMSHFVGMVAAANFLF